MPASPTFRSHRVCVCRLIDLNSLFSLIRDNQCVMQTFHPNHLGKHNYSLRSSGTESPSPFSEDFSFSSNFCRSIHQSSHVQMRLLSPCSNIEFSLFSLCSFHLSHRQIFARRKKQSLVNQRDCATVHDFCHLLIEFPHRSISTCFFFSVRQCSSCIICCRNSVFPSKAFKCSSVVIILIQSTQTFVIFHVSWSSSFECCSHPVSYVPTYSSRVKFLLSPEIF